MSIIDDMLDATAEQRELEKMNASFYKARKEEAETILKDIVCFDVTSEESLEQISKRAYNYFNPILGKDKIVDFS